MFGINNFYDHTVEGWANLIHPDDRKMMLDYFKNTVIGKGRRFDKEYRIVRPNDKAVRWVHGLGKLVFDDQKKPVTMMGTIEDVTEYKIIQQKLIKSEQKFSKAFEISPYALVISKIDDGRLIEVNGSFSKLTGIARKEALGKTTLELNLWANGDERNSMIDELKKKGSVTGMQLNIKSKTGKILSGLYSASKIDIDGIPCILSSIANISELKRAEEEILELKNRNETILTSIGDAVFACDKNGKVLLFNEAAEKLTGIPAEKVIGQKYNKVMTFLREADEKPVSDFVSEVIKRNEIIKNINHTLLLTKTGVKIPVANSVAPIKIATGAVVGCVVSFRDVSHEREIDKAKSEFVSLASHQLRTPLTAINWYCEMLLSEESAKLTDKQRLYAKETYAASKRMVRLMNALLNVSRLEMGSFIVEPVPLKIADVVKTCIGELTPQISQKNTILKERYDPNIPLFNADQKLLTIIIQNLLSNAVKYSRDGGVVNLAIHRSGDDMLITVTDNGIGIPAGQKDLMFTKLFRADNGKQADPDGTGLGLYIVKTIVDTTGGKVWFKSTEGKGSEFSVSFPLSGMVEKGGTKRLV